MLRFTLKQLLILIAAISMILGVYFTPAWRQYRAIAAIRTVGGTVDYLVDVNDPTEESGWFPRDLAETVIAVDLTDCTGVTPALLSSVAALRDTQTIYMKNSDISDQDLAFLAQMTKLQGLDLDNTRITDSGLTHIAKCPSLLWLRLDSTMITNEGIETLTALSQLQSLDVRNTLLTNEGLWQRETFLPGCRIFSYPSR